MNNERRVFETEIREMQAVGRPFKYLEGRAVPYGVWADVGPFMESHAPNSFKASTRGGSGKPGLPLLLFHDQQRWPAGHVEKWTHSADGLYGVWKLNDSPEAQTAAKMAESGDLIGMSVGFMPQKTTLERSVTDWAPDMGPDYKDWILRVESRLVEVSLTPTPVYADAQVTLVRTAYDYEARAREARATPKLDAWLEAAEVLHSRGARPAT